jgi:hypothetical protein
MKSIKMLYRTPEGLKECLLHHIGQGSVMTDIGIMHRVVALVSDSVTGEWKFIEPTQLVNPKIKS